MWDRCWGLGDFFLFLKKYLFIWLHWMLDVAHGIFGLCYGMRDFVFGMWDLVPWPGIEPRPPVLGAQHPSQWTTREAPGPCELLCDIMASAFPFFCWSFTIKREHRYEIIFLPKIKGSHKHKAVVSINLKDDEEYPGRLPLVRISWISRAEIRLPCRA